MWELAIILNACMFGAFPGEPGTVVLRSGSVIEASEVRPANDSLRLTTAGSERVLGWQEVLEVKGRAAGEVAEFLPLADDAWRGLSRLARGDRVAAEPLLERAFALLSGRTGPTAQAVSEGLLICRAARGAQTLAIEPYLTLVLSNQVSVTSDILDAQTALFPALPPIWATESGLAAAVGSIAWDDFAKWGTSGRARQLAELYSTAALFEITGQAPVTRLIPVDDGVKLVQEMVVARVGSEQERGNARQALASRLSSDQPDWRIAWIHASVGLSLLIEGDDHSSRLGIVQLLYVPAMYKNEQPYLAGVCLAQAAIRLAEMGRGEAAVSLAGELSHDFADHPAMEHPVVRELIKQYQDQSNAASHPKESA